MDWDELIARRRGQEHQQPPVPSEQQETLVQRHVREIVDRAPPLSPDVRRRLAEIFASDRHE